MTGEPLLDFLRHNPVVHPLELPDTQLFLESGGSALGLTFTFRSQRFRSQLQHPLAVQFVESVTRQFRCFAWLGSLKGQKRWMRDFLRGMKPSGQKLYREAARVLVHHGTRREEVRMGLLLLCFLGQPEDLEAARILARNEAFTAYALPIISRHSPTRELDYLNLFRIIEGSEKLVVLAQYVKALTSEKIKHALEHGFPTLNLPIWRYGRFDQLNELKMLKGADKIWARPRLQEAILTKPHLAALLAKICDRHDDFRERVLSQTRIITHYFIHPDPSEVDWSHLALKAIESEHISERRQGWMVARETGLDLDKLAESRLGRHPDDYIAWEQVVAFLSNSALLDAIIIPLEPSQPAFELGLCPQRWKWARVLEPVLRGLVRFPGRRGDLVVEGLSHPVIEVRLSALGVASVWPDDSFQEQVEIVASTDPVSKVREVASKVAARSLLQSPYLEICRQALSEMTEIPAHLVAQLETSLVYEATRPEMLVAYVKFAGYHTVRCGRSIGQDTSLGLCIVDLDPQDQRIRCIEIV